MGGGVGGLLYLVVERVDTVGVLHQLVDGEGGVIGLHNGIRDLYRWVGGWVD